jgi:hypothetical protein
MELSICSVSFKTASEIRWNVALSKRMNPEPDLHWLAAENTPADFSERLSETEKDIAVIPGAGAGHTPTYHHTIALGNAISRATTRFILILDPDFFVITTEWAGRMIRHMLSNELSILGVPWHPRQSEKYRYFPAVHCSLFDTERFPKGSIDFLPDYPNGASDPNWPHGFVKDESYFCEKPISRLLARIPAFRSRRHFYTDTGSRLFKRHVLDPRVTFELIDPVYDAARHREKFPWRSLLIEKALPDELCYLPKHYRNTRDDAFLHRYATEPVPADWEEFTWGGAPFGFHMRRNNNLGRRSRREELDLAGRILDSVRRSDNA